MERKKVSVIRINYELPNKPDYNWTANIAAYNSDEAINFLRKKLGNIKIISIEVKTSLDAISNEVEETIIKPHLKRIEEQNQAQRELSKPAKAPQKEIQKSKTKSNAKKS